MSLQRANPIPPGIYWVDAIGQAANDGWGKWSHKNTKIRILQRTVRGRHDVWWLFEVIKPVKRWPIAANLGFPTVAKQGAKTTAKSTVQRPKVKSSSELLTDWGGVVANTLQSGFALIAIAYILANRRR